MHNDRSIKEETSSLEILQKRFDPYKCAFLVACFLKESAVSYGVDLNYKIERGYG